MSKKNTQIGTFYKRTDKNTGELVSDSKGRQQYTFSLNKDVVITINGKRFEGKYFYVNRPDEKYDIMINSGKITEEEYDQKVGRYQEGGDLSNLVFELVAPEK